MRIEKTAEFHWMPLRGQGAGGGGSGGGGSGGDGGGGSLDDDAGNGGVTNDDAGGGTDNDIEWCVRGPAGRGAGEAVGVTAASGSVRAVLLGEEIRPGTYRVQQAERSSFGWWRWGRTGEWCVRGPAGREGELVEVRSRRTGEVAMVFLYREVEFGVYMFERC